MLAGAKLYATLRARRSDALTDARRGTVLIGAAVGALVGSRALAILEHPGILDGVSGAELLVLVFSAKTIVGGLLGGLIGVEATKAFLGEKSRTGDLYVYPVILAIAIGRVGCFLAGVQDATAGSRSSLPWALDQGDGVLRHPTALYEILFLGALALVLRRLERRTRLAPGALFALFLSAYLAWRLGVEFIKPVEPLALGLSAIQWACVVGLVHYARLAISGQLAKPPLKLNV